MKYSELFGIKFMVSLGGAELTCSDPEGEPLWAVGLSAGVHDALTYREYMSRGCKLALSKGAIAISRGGERVASMSIGPAAMETGANPDFRPSSMTESELRMRRMVTDFSAKQNSAERRIAAMQRALEMKAKPVDEPVVEEPAEKPAEPAEKPAEPAEKPAEKSVEKSKI